MSTSQSTEAKQKFDKIYAARPKAKIWLKWTPRSYPMNYLQGAIVAQGKTHIGFAFLLNGTHFQHVDIPYHNIFMVEYTPIDADTVDL